MEKFSQLAYEKQLEIKKQKTLAEFKPYYDGELEVFSSAIAHYRMRAEFRVWHDEDELYYVMFDQVTKEKFRVEKFEVADALINALMPHIIENVLCSPLLKKKLFQVDFLSSLSGEVVVSLLYHKQLDDEWLAEALLLREKLRKIAPELHIIGRARKQKLVLDRDYVEECLRVGEQFWYYKQVENSFTQPNAKVAEKMLAWAIKSTKCSSGDLLELYCGNGNFSIALAQNFNQVLATELAKPSVESAHYNIEKNKIKNLKIARLSAEELTEAMNEERLFRRLQQQEIDLKYYDFSTVLVDPPRAGLDNETLKMIQQFQTIVYISCNPLTLLTNLEVLSKSHVIESMALFDQFPYTKHREVGVLLKKKA